MESPRSILVLKPSSFGDIIHTLPAVVRIKERWPDAQITWLANTEWCPLLEGNPVIDRVIAFPRQQLRGWRGLMALPGWLRKSLERRYDLVLDYQGLLRTALLGRYVRSGRFVGLEDAREGAKWFYNERAPTPTGVPHAVERYLSLSRVATRSSFASEPSSEFERNLSFPLPEGDPVELPELATGGFVLLHPFARGQDKSLSFKQVGALCEYLRAKPVVLVGRFFGDASVLPPQCVNLLNRTTLRQLIWLTRRAGFVVSVDSGPAHLAAALGKPMVAIHTWSDPRRVGPYLREAWVLKSNKLLRFSKLRMQGEAFFKMPSAPVSAEQLEAIGALATSS